MKTVRHEFRDPVTSFWGRIFGFNDDEKFDPMNNEAVICVGSTGTGKSSLIKLFCGNNVKVGHSVRSETQGSSLFKEAGSGRYWLDSQGANDSQGADDEKVLADILRTLYDHKISNIKVIWCISGDFDRAKQEFKTQAHFIKSLGDGVWKSCLIVQKKGPIKPNNIAGVLAAANAKRANVKYGDHRLFGFTGIDFMQEADKNKDRLLSKILRNTKPNTHKRKQELLEDGYLNNKQIVEHINQRLRRLESFKITFAIKVCDKCGLMGDPRFIYAPCHTESEKYHPMAAIPYHDGHKQNKHMRGLERYHPGYVSTTYRDNYYHWHDELTREEPPSEAEMIAAGIFTAGIHTYATGIKAIAGDYNWKHKCCGKPEGSQGCCNNREAIVKYTCCGRSSGSEGCSRRYQCCNGSEYSRGCREEWDCCNAPSNHKGCQRKHPCCNKDARTTNGCKKRCKRCHKNWGKTSGCTATTKIRNRK